MTPKWQKLASLAQEIWTLYSFSSLVQSLLPKDTLLRTYLHSQKMSSVLLFIGLTDVHCVEVKTQVNTPGRLQSKTLLTIDKCGSKITRNSVFYCHLSPVWRQMAIENSVSKDF